MESVRIWTCITVNMRKMSGITSGPLSRRRTQMSGKQTPWRFPRTPPPCNSDSSRYSMRTSSSLVFLWTIFTFIMALTVRWFRTWHLRGKAVTRPLSTGCATIPQDVMCVTERLPQRSGSIQTTSAAMQSLSLLRHSRTTRWKSRPLAIRWCGFPARSPRRWSPRYCLISQTFPTPPTEVGS